MTPAVVWGIVQFVVIYDAGTFMLQRASWRVVINYHPALELIGGPISRPIALLSNFLQGYMKVMTSSQMCKQQAAKQSHWAAAFVFSVLEGGKAFLNLAVALRPSRCLTRVTLQSSFCF